MEKTKKFDLMNHKPTLDRDTLNYVWDMLWRFNATAEGTNNDKRIRISERQRIMDLIEELANNS